MLEEAGGGGDFVEAVSTRLRRLLPPERIPLDRYNLHDPSTLAAMRALLVERVAERCGDDLGAVIQTLVQSSPDTVSGIRAYLEQHPGPEGGMTEDQLDELRKGCIADFGGPRFNY